MMNYDTINKGDFVGVHFKGLPRIDGYVKYYPCAPGDMWYIKTQYPNGEYGLLAINPSSSELLYIEKRVGFLLESE